MKKYVLLALLLFTRPVLAADDLPVSGDRIERLAISARADGALEMEVLLATTLQRGDRVTATVAYSTNLSFTFSAAIEPTELTETGYTVTLTNQFTGQTNWSSEFPNLYKAVVTLEEKGEILNITTQRFGFRTVEVRDFAGLFVNGSRVLLKGCAYELPEPAADGTPAAKQLRQELGQIKRLNMNAVRVAQADPALLNLCDELGLYVVGVDAENSAHPSVIAWADGQVQNVRNPSHEELPIAATHASNFIATEMLGEHHDFSAGAGLEDYWNIIRVADSAVGCFLANASGASPEMAAGRATIRDVLNPVEITDRKLHPLFDGTLHIANHHSFADLGDTSFQWAYLKLPAAADSSTKLRIIQEGVTNTPGDDWGKVSFAPHSKTNLNVPARNTAPEADALRVIALDRNKKKVGTWFWKFAAAAALNPTPAQRKDLVTELKEEEGHFRTSVGPVEYRVRQSDGALASIRNGGGEMKCSSIQLIASGTKTTEDADGKMTTVAVDLAGESKLTNITGNVGWDRSIIEATYDGALSKVTWTPLPDGWIQLAYEYELNATVQKSGISLGYPQDKIKSVRWLGHGPSGIWKNRTRGTTLGVWTNAVSDGFIGPWLWAQLETEDGTLTLANQTDATSLDLTAPGIAILDAIPALGTAAIPAEKIGPQSQPAKLSGLQRGSLLLLYEPLKLAP